MGEKTIRFTYRIYFLKSLCIISYNIDRFYCIQLFRTQKIKVHSWNLWNFVGGVAATKRIEISSGVGSSVQLRCSVSSKLEIAEKIQWFFAERPIEETLTEYKIHHMSDRLVSLYIYNILFFYCIIQYIIYIIYTVYVYSI